MPSLDEIRTRFPALRSGYVFMDNAGGSQVPDSVIHAISAYMEESYVQVGADYPASVRASETVAEAHRFIETLMGGQQAGKAILGSSTSSLLRMLADCYAESLPAGSRIIVAASGHEANVSPWVHLARRGFDIVLWKPNPETGTCEGETLQALLNDQTRIVAFPHVSNLLGGVEDIATLTHIAHQAGARVVVDGVAYAPHLPMKVADWGVDWYVFSTYKVFGPHMAALLGTHEAQAEIEGPGHFFIPRSEVPYKFELGGVNHEGCAGLLGLREYLSWLGGNEAMQVVANLEKPLTEKVLGYLRSRPELRIVGRADSGEGRLPTISFVHPTKRSQQIVDAVAEHRIGIRWGNFYSYRLLQEMGIDPESGVVRVSLAHTNSESEVESLLEALDEALA